MVAGRRLNSQGSSPASGSPAGGMGTLRALPEVF
jgi:hypothetical protein